ncbi:MAG TPA: choice-of-anchor R domain-containing protein [Clostridia bacterium]
MDNSELDMNQTPFLWNNRVSIPVPADMAVSTTEANIKCQAIHQFPCQFSDTYTSYPWVNNHARSDEVFWKKDMSNLAFNATVTSSSQDNTNGLIASNVVDGIILGAPYSTEQDYLYDSGSNTYNFEYFINGQPHVVTDFSELRITHKEEWAAGGNNAGAWVQLNWGTPVTANQIKLYDRPDINNNIISGTLQFSDGTSVAVGKLNTNGAATTVNFPLKTFYWVKFVINSAEGTNVGLSEFEVYNSNNGFYNLTHSSGIGYTFGMSSDEIKRGQTFTANENISLSSIDIMIRKYTGTAQSAVKVELYATNGTAPTGTALAVATVPASSIGTSFSTINVPLVYNNLSAGTKYAIVLSQVTPSNANTYLWSIKESNIKEGMFKWNASSWINESNIGDGWLRVNYKRNNGVVDI